MPAGATVQDVWAALVAAHPAAAVYERSMSCAVNLDYARMTAPVADGDEVAFLPPVSGGSGAERDGGVMFDKLASVEQRYETIAAAMASQAVQSDANEYRKQAKALAEIEPLVLAYRDYQKVGAEIAQAEELAKGGDAEMARAGRRGADRARRPSRRACSPRSRCCSCPRIRTTRRTSSSRSAPAPAARRPALFAADLFRMYSRFAERQRWKIEMMSLSEVGQRHPRGDRQHRGPAASTAG